MATFNTTELTLIIALVVMVILGIAVLLFLRNRRTERLRARVRWR